MSEAVMSAILSTIWILMFGSCMYALASTIRAVGQEIAHAIRGKSVSAQAAALVQHAQELAALKACEHVWSTPQTGEKAEPYCIRCEAKLDARRGSFTGPF